MKKIHVLILGLLMLTVASCGDQVNEKNGEIISTIAEGAQTDAELKEELKRIEREEKQRIEDEKRNVTTLSFDRLEHDFGRIQEDTDNFTEFVVTNTGNKPLIIDDVKASCGCTTPQKPEKPIAPGKSDKIKVKFHPNPEQLNEIQKTISVSANTEPRISTISVKAFVVKK